MRDRHKNPFYECAAATSPGWREIFFFGKTGGQGSLITEMAPHAFLSLRA